MPTAELISIKELSGKRFVIPAYQRGYRWTQRQIKDLVDDLHAFSKKDGAKKYCLQPIVLEKKTDNYGDYYNVIDGQQRLTSLFLLGAVYKCLNHEDETPYNTYTNYELAYEEKDGFGAFIKIVGECNTPQEIKNNLDEWENKYRDIDSQYAINILKFLTTPPKNWRPATALHNIYEKLNEDDKDVCIIWHELDTQNSDDSDKAVETFANINANKIPLTDAELIKAVLLQAFGNKAPVDDDNGDKKLIHSIASELESAFAAQWEAIERGLNNENFWSFFIKDDHYKTRIDILFEIWIANNSMVLPATDHALFKVVNAYLQQSTTDIKKFWDDIVEIYETLQDWHKSYYIYHMIGALSLIKTKTAESNAQFVCSLYNDYKNSKKSAFRENLKSRLREVYNAFMGNLDLRNLSYDKTANETKNVLLLFNIALLLNANESCKLNKAERFPFDYCKTHQIDIEHINPRNPSENKKEKREKWQEANQDVLRDVNEGAFVDNTLANKDTANATMEKWAAKAEIHTLGNLTLVDSKLNIGFSNGTFMEKRNHVIATMRGESVTLESGEQKIYDESVLLPGARWVFLREWREEGGLSISTLSKSFWSKEERSYYVGKIESSLEKLLKADKPEIKAEEKESEEKEDEANDDTAE